MSISKKKLREINLVADTTVFDIFKEFPLHSAQDNWWEYPPETWNTEERNYWDVLFELRNRLMLKFVNIVDKNIKDESI